MGEKDRNKVLGNNEETDMIESLWVSVIHCKGSYGLPILRTMMYLQNDMIEDELIYHICAWQVLLHLLLEVFGYVSLYQK